jgi:hypothetical protein
MFDKFGETAIEVLFDAFGNSRRFKSESITSEHLLAALCMGEDNMASEALASMNISSDNILKEIERILFSGTARDIATAQFEVCNLPVEDLKFSEASRLILKHAVDIRTFFGHELVEPEHILLSLIDIRDEGTIKLLEELGANFTYLNWHITALLAKRDALYTETLGLKKTVIHGLAELIAERTIVFDDIERISQTSGIPAPQLPQRSEIAHFIVTYYLPDFLFVQIGFQRYLLEETIKLLTKRAGSVDPEFAASTVSTAAQNLRSGVRQTIEYVWSHEFKHLSKLPEEADYDLIGSVIEDLWWTHSEEIALNQVFDNALEDHRRGQMLDLQKRRLEICERIVRLRSRLGDVIKQCFLKRTPAA